MKFGLYSSIANPPRVAHHPVCVPEDVITLDLVSKGRVILGVGIGYQPADFRAFSVPIKDRAGRFEERIERQALHPRR
jgi:alkanesulfonate monooxygenase SsuD/methylene tetrahydromethanopterin reductase-like flavin-dependent oxidoreductase (luciferase family)